MSRLNDQVERFNRRVMGFHTRCIRIEREFIRRRLKITDVELVYCSGFLSIYSQWEALLEEILYEVVCGNTSKRPGNYRHAIFRSRRHFEKVLLFPEKAYLSIHDLKRAESLAALFVNNGRPISAVTQRNRTLLEQATRIRNAIAHDSSVAKKKFREGVPGVSALPRPKRTPGAFLRHEFRQQPSQRRCEVYFTAFRNAATEIARAW